MIGIQKRKSFTKSRLIKVWDYNIYLKLITDLKMKYINGTNFKSCYTRIMKASKRFDNTLTKEKHSSTDRDFQCEKIERRFTNNKS